MEACSEATEHILNLTHTVARLKQLASTEQIQRGKIIDIGEDMLKAWMNGEPYSEVYHARWAEATDPKSLEKKFKQINKEFDRKEQEQREQMQMTAEQKANQQKEKDAEAINADAKLQKAKNSLKDAEDKANKKKEGK